MRGFIQNVEKTTRVNTDFRRVLYTAKYSQLVVMSIKPGDEIGFETHILDQFFKIVNGVGHIIMSGVTTEIYDGFGIIVPAGINHNIINTGRIDLKLYSIYSPPNHLDGTVHHTHTQATENHSYFDGKTTE